MKITTTSGLIGTLSSLGSKKLEYSSLIAMLENELAESDLIKRINTGKKLLKELEQEELEIRKQGIEILDKAGIEKFEANGIEVRKKVGIGSLIIDDADKIDNDYKTEETKTTIKINKNEIKKDLKEGVIIQGVHLEQKISLEIKYS